MLGEVLGDDAVDAFRICPSFLTALVEVVIGIGLCGVIGADRMQDLETAWLGDERVESVGSVALHFVDGNEGEGVLLEPPETGLILLKGGCSGGLI